MGTADFKLHLTLRGTPEELQALEDTFQEYVTGKNGVSFSNYGTPIRSNGCVEIFTSGPWGRYGELNDVDVFRDMAEVAPGASFEAKISGSTTYTYQTLNASLNDGILHISTYFEGNEEADEAYSDYFRNALPYRKFLKLFHLDKVAFDEDCYEDFTTSEIFEDFSEWDYESFMETFEDNLVEDIDEDTFEEIIEAFRALDIQNFDVFRGDNADGFGREEEMDYDPVAKAYIGRPAPLKAGQIYSAEDLAEHGIDVKKLASEIFGDKEDTYDDEEFEDEDD